jgi:hypothetical protein
VCDGPRTRFYCSYNDDAIESDGGNEQRLGFDPMSGEWSISLPCSGEDLLWVQNALSKISKKITARDEKAGVIEENKHKTSAENSLLIDQNGFFGV